MKKFLLLIALWGLILSACACSGSAQTDSGQGKSIERTVLEKFGTEYNSIYNQSKSHILYVYKEKKTPLNPLPVLKFMIFDCKAGHLLFEDSIPGGKIKWLKDTLIEVTRTPGIVTKNDQERTPGYIFDVNNGRKVESSNSSTIIQN